MMETAVELLCIMMNLNKTNETKQYIDDDELNNIIIGCMSLSDDNNMNKVPMLKNILKMTNIIFEERNGIYKINRNSNV